MKVFLCVVSRLNEANKVTYHTARDMQASVVESWWGR